MRKRRDKLMIKEFKRWRELAFSSPLVFASTGGMGPLATTVFRKLASMLAEKWDIKCSCWLDVT